MTQPELFGFVTCDYEHQFTRVHYRGIGWVAVHRQNPRCINPVPFSGADCEGSA